MEEKGAEDLNEVYVSFLCVVWWYSLGLVSCNFLSLLVFLFSGLYPFCMAGRSRVVVVERFFRLFLDGFLGFCSLQSYLCCKIFWGICLGGVIDRGLGAGLGGASHFLMVICGLGRS